MDKKLYNALCKESTDMIDEMYHTILNSPHSFSRAKMEAVSRRWHELHDKDMKGVTSTS